MTASAVENLRRHRVEFVHGTATLGPDRSVVVQPADGGAPRRLTGDVIIIATYAEMKNKDAQRHKPLVVLVDDKNREKVEAKEPKPAKTVRDDDD